MRVVIDTNVIMSAIFFGGVPFEVLNAWHDGEFELVISEAVMAEYREIAGRMRSKFQLINLEGWLSYIQEHATMTLAAPLEAQVCDDADDDVFLACAVSADAKIVCSGDRHLLACNGWQGIEVLTPRVFCNRIRGQ